MRKSGGGKELSPFSYFSYALSNIRDSISQLLPSFTSIPIGGTKPYHNCCNNLLQKPQKWDKYVQLYFFLLSFSKVKLHLVHTMTYIKKKIKLQREFLSFLDCSIAERGYKMLNFTHK